MQSNYTREFQKAREIYLNLCSVCPNADTLDADTIIHAITGKGLYLLKKHKFIEPCACTEGKHFYAI